MRQPYTEDKDDMSLAERGRDNKPIATPNRTPQDEKVKLQRIIYDTEDEEDISLSERRRRAARTSQSPMAYTNHDDEEDDMPLWRRRRKVVNCNEESPIEMPTPRLIVTLPLPSIKVGRGRKQKTSVTKPRTRADGPQLETCKGSSTQQDIRRLMRLQI
ncbi:hypothetical protein HII31_05771 [Pseudocercospora fuligena]|uniref:Uncharacterized protein n=1 Tax=Pseudocercospora fuligena TaxID=685502 RepID=A0A8H6RI34_9PEZI|nr:hypothetical protein HII31_05771 [Pseudocercospora fuligena]